MLNVGSPLDVKAGGWKLEVRCWLTLDVGCQVSDVKGRFVNFRHRTNYIGHPTFLTFGKRPTKYRLIKNIVADSLMVSIFFPRK
jgi:hypothetical protein